MDLPEVENLVAAVKEEHDRERYLVLSEVTQKEILELEQVIADN